MPEAVFVCLDSSDHMRNGDYFPSRMSAAQEAVSLLLSAKMQRNPENTIGFLTLGGNACTVCESLTADADAVMASLTKVQPSGGIHFLHGLQIASLALSHRQNPIAEKRVIAFVSSPLDLEEKVVEKMAKKLRKDEVAVDIVAFGPPTNNTLLEKFISVVNKNNNSHFLYVNEGTSICDSVLSSAVVYGEEAPPAGAGAGGGATGGFEFGVDPNLDPELAMVLRLSMEEERRRQEGPAATEGDAAPKPDAAPANPADVTTPQGQSTQPGTSAEGRVLTEEEELERALMLSMQEAEAEAAGAAEPESKEEKKDEAPTDPSVANALEDPEFLAELEKEVEESLKKPEEE